MKKKGVVEKVSKIGGIILKEEPGKWMNPVSEEVAATVSKQLEGKEVEFEVDEQNKYSSFQAAVSEPTRSSVANYLDPREQSIVRQTCLKVAAELIKEMIPAQQTKEGFMKTFFEMAEEAEVWVHR